MGRFFGISVRYQDCLRNPAEQRSVKGTSKWTSSSTRRKRSWGKTFTFFAGRKWAANLPLVKPWNCLLKTYYWQNIGQRMINAMAPLLLFIFLSTLKLEHTTLNWWKKHPAPCFSALSSICMRKERTPRYWTTSSCSKGLPNSLQVPVFKANCYLLAIDKSSSNDFVITIETKSKSVFRSLPIYQKIEERLEISARMILTKPNFIIF